MAKKFNISYFYAKLQVKTTNLDYSDLGDIFIQKGIINKSKSYYSMKEIEEIWLPLRDYLGRKLEEIILNDPVVENIARKALEK